MNKELDKFDVYECAVMYLQDIGHVEATLFEDYSGREMYGETTVGIVAPTNLGAMLGWAITYAVDTLLGEDADDPAHYLNVLDCAMDMLPKRTDSLGTDTIYY